MEDNILLTKPQSDFFLSEEPYPAFVAGFASGKSFCMTMCVLRDLDLGEGVKIACYAPTYDLLKLITIPYLEEMLEKAGETYRLNKSENIFYLSEKRQIICRSMDNPARIVGYEVLRSHIDELDTLKEEPAKNAFNKIIARNRQKIIIDGEMVKNRVCSYTTPEGFSFVYKRWVKEKPKGYKIYKAPTRSNPNIPDDYIDNLRASYPPQLIESYLEGEFVNLTSGAVYPQFDRVLNNTEEVIKRGDALHIGMDFNVHNMAARIHVIKNGIPYCLDEIDKARDTPEICDIIKERYPNYNITIYPDASGKGTSAKSASLSDISILKAAGFKVKAPSKNPFIKDRLNSVNAKICNGKGERSYFVNVKNCPTAAENLEQQIYDDNSQPDKKAGHDHGNDALGYFIDYVFPVRKKSASVKKVSVLAR